MAKDPLVPNFSPSIAPDAVVRRHPQEVNGRWDLEGIVPHTGTNSKTSVALVASERIVLNALYGAEPFEKMIEFADVLKLCGIDRAAEYWLPSLMAKVGVDTLPALFDAVKANPSLLEAPATLAQLPHGISAGGPAALH